MTTYARQLSNEMRCGLKSYKRPYLLENEHSLNFSFLLNSYPQGIQV